jgi:hypothetical protein
MGRPDGRTPYPFRHHLLHVFYCPWPDPYRPKQTVLDSKMDHPAEDALRIRPSRLGADPRFEHRGAKKTLTIKRFFLQNDHKEIYIYNTIIYHVLYVYY